ncbi:MAG: histidine--tRNA ligase [Prevotellaceae bacterium]|jgi:histidyl-tRNA synthetase|nr:histidine--tRNA ligase [Prevotellaceae bacterium]
MQKPSIPKGTRDFSPDEMSKRNYIFDTVRKVFYIYGFKQIETPAMENLSTLLGKYGDEGDKLLFKILNSGDFMSAVSADELLQTNSVKLANTISEKGLRYDLTVPFARFVVQNRDKITFPFKRFQIQPVWRADRPQKGRYREFYQCDVDMIGSNSLINEFELIQIVDDIFGRLKINISIKLNNRKILSGIAEFIGEPQRITDITVAIDKFDKIGLDNVKKELEEKNISAEAINKLQPVLQLKGTNAEKLSALKNILSDSQTGLKGINEIETIFEYLKTVPIQSEIELDLTLARGLNYYTGAIIEVKALDMEIGSIAGGGRYDNLTGVFGMEGVSGVGISFGADRIYDVLNQLNLFPENTAGKTQLLFVTFGKNELNYCLPVLQKLRKAGINAEIYPEQSKLKKQLSYADANNIEFVAIVGENELNNGSVSLKNMITGEQNEVQINDLTEILINNQISKTL